MTTASTPRVQPGHEHALADRCFGGRVEVRLSGPGAEEAAAETIERLHGIDLRLSRFRPDSELCRVNRDSREIVTASPLLLELAAAIAAAGERTGGLVDGTLLDAIERAGYVRSMTGETRAAATPLSLPAPSPPAVPDQPGWALLRVDRERRILRRPHGVRLDSGGLGKGIAADRAAAGLRRHSAFCVDCSGDLRIGGTSSSPRAVRVSHPLSGEVACEFRVADGGVATSGVTRRSWRDERGRPRHHLIDPRTGEPARTGVIQVTALAPTATEAEVLAKAALLSGADEAHRWLPHGGAVVLEDGSVEEHLPDAEPPEAVT